MRRGMRFPLMAAVGLAAALAAPARAADQAAGGGITGSVHDFTTAGGNTGAQYNGTVGGTSAGTGAGVCVFCHIQHRTSSSSNGSLVTPTTASTRLLWNHKLSAQSFSWSDATQTQGGTTLPTNLGTWAGSTKNCLGCHDGTVSVGDVYRGYHGQAFTDAGWTGGNVNATGFITRSYLVIGPQGDLKGNHPVGIPYPYQGASSTYNGITTGTKVNPADYVASPVNVKLFSQVSATEVIQGATAGASGIECGSCHDAHNKHAVEEPLLRDYYTNSSGHPSQICLDCHNK